MRYLPILSLLLLFLSCHSYQPSQEENKETNTSNTFDRERGIIAAFSEVVAAGVKQLALSSPMSSQEMEEFLPAAKEEALKFGVSVFRETDLIVTDLFPADVAKDKEVLLLYTGNTKDAYLQLKADQAVLQKEGRYDAKASRDISRRFGRLLSYTPKKINQLLAQQTDFRTMADFGIQATNLFLYCKDLQAAGDFYTDILGMELIADYGMALILRMTSDSYLILVDATKGMHTAEEPKTVALALLTDQLREWYDYLVSKEISIKYKYKEGAAHDGFVAVDPEGYLLEFERFNQHWENEKFVPILAKNKTHSIPTHSLSSKPDHLKIHSTITWLYHKDVLAMQHFYENALGLELAADQGWTKIYQASKTGFIAIVDGKRGMHTFTEKKAVNVGFIIEDLADWFDYAQANKVLALREDELSTGPESRYKAFVGYGPEQYYWEFNAFYPHSDNALFLKYLDDPTATVDRTTLQPNIQTFPADCSIRAITAMDENTMWYGGSKGQFGYTEDGGATWQIDSIQSDKQPKLEFRGIATTADAIFLLAVGSPALLYKSTDKTKTWSLVYEDTHPKAFYDAIRFWDDQNGIAMGDPTDGCLSIILTNDGGTTWRKIPCAQLPFTGEGEAAFAASNSNIALVGDHAWIVTGGKKARVFHSANKGKTWNVHDTPIIQGGQMTGIFTTDFYNDQQGIIFGGNWEDKSKNTQNKAMTKDGGKNWTLVADGQHPGYRSAVQYVPNSGGKKLVAVGSPGISYSVDGGATWELLSHDSFYTIQFCADGKTAWLAGRNKIGKMVLDLGK